MDSLSPTAISSAISNLKKVIEDLPNIQKEVAKAANSSAKEAAKSETEQSLIKVGLDPKGPSNPVQAVVDAKLQGFPPATDTTSIVIPPEPCPSGLTLNPKTNKCVVASRGGSKRQTRKKRSKRSRRSR